VFNLHAILFSNWRRFVFVFVFVFAMLIIFVFAMLIIFVFAMLIIFVFAMLIIFVFAMLIITKCSASIRADGCVNPVPVVSHIGIHSVQTFPSTANTKANCPC